MTLRYGAPAPDFTLPSTQGQDVALASFRGRADVVLAFYCYDWGRI
jgi:peroxiredoxin